MFTIDADPRHDRTFAQVAPRLEEWHTRQGLRPSAIERAWLRAGFALEYTVAVSRHVAYCAGTTAVAFLPLWAATAHPVYRDIILRDVARHWEEEGRRDTIDALALALTALAAEEYGDQAA
jgi:hypothetical protein